MMAHRHIFLLVVLAVGVGRLRAQIVSVNDEAMALAPNAAALARGSASIAYVRAQGASPGVMFLGGFASDMTGTKATALDAWARRRGQAFVRFDYQGHGASSGRFADGTIGTWAADALAVALTGWFQR